MKKVILIALALMLAVGTAAFASGESESIQGNMENGGYTLMFPLSEGTWDAKEPSEDSAVRIAFTGEENGWFTVRYEAVRDGDATVTIRHMDGDVCDQLHGFDLTVKDGVIQENTGGFYTASPDDEDLTPFIVGEWAEKDTQVLRLSVSKAEGKGWLVEVTSPMTHEAFVLRASIRFDCELDAFVYQDGSLFNLPAEGELGEPVQTGLTGRFEWSVKEEDSLALLWTADETLDSREVVFEPLSAE